MEKANQSASFSSRLVPKGGVRSFWLGVSEKKSDFWRILIIKKEKILKRKNNEENGWLMKLK